MKTAVLLIASLLLAPAMAQADEGRECEQSSPRSLQLDFQGIDTVVFDIGGNHGDIRASADASGKVEGRACASSADRLERMTLTQERSGSTLTVHALRNGDNDKNGNYHVSLFGKTMSACSYLKFTASIPNDVMVQLDVGSGDASIEGARAASADVGSGDFKASHISERFTAKVGSGDLIVEDVGSLELLSLASGDATIKRVRGASKIGSVGSGDVDIIGTQGAIEVGSSGSGDLTFNDVDGDVSVGSVGSGDLEVDGVRGSLTVRSIGSGDVGHRNVSGRVELPKND